MREHIPFAVFIHTGRILCRKGILRRVLGGVLIACACYRGVRCRRDGSQRAVSRSRRTQRIPIGDGIRNRLHQIGDGTRNSIS